MRTTARIKRLAMVAASWLAITACATTKPAPADEPTEVEVLVANALAARTRPVIEVPAQPLAALGRCAVEIGPRPETHRAAILAEFAARNGEGWRTAEFGNRSFDPSTGFLTDILEPTDPARDGLIVSRTDDEALEMAVDFLATNHDLYGLTRADLAHVTADVSPEDDSISAIVRTVDLKGQHSPGGSAKVEIWHLIVSINRVGQIRAVHAQHPSLLPAVQLCSKPLLTADDARLLREVIGHDLSYYEMFDKLVPVGPVTADQVTPPRLVIDRQPSPEGTHIVVRVAYEIIVNSNVAGPWSFLVDADTGALIRIHALFIT